MKTKKITRFELLMTTIGCVVGSGVVTATGLAVGETGRSAWLSYGLAVLIGFLLAIPTIFSSSMMVVDGGNYTTTRLFCGPTIAATSSLAGVLNFFGNGMMSLAIASYVVSLLPGLNANVVAGVVLTVLWLLNLFGVKMVARVQAFVSPIMMLGLVAFIVFGLTKLQFDPFGFSDPDFFLNGADGLLSGCTLLCFSTQGTVSAIFYNRQAANPKKDVPWAICWTTVFILVLYCGVALVDGNVLPVDQVAGLPLTNVAFAIMPNWLAVLFVVFGPIMCIITTVNGGWASFYKPISACAKEGIIPAVIGKETKTGMPIYILIAQYIFAMFPIVTGLSISTIMNALVLAMALLNIFVRIGAFRMPKMFPEAWAKSHLHCPDIVYYFCCVVALAANVFLAWLSIKSLELPLILLNFGVMIVAYIYCRARIKAGKVTERSITYTLYDHFEDDPEIMKAQAEFDASVSKK